MQIYFLQHGPNGPIKIGRAANPAKRMKDMQTACPYDFKMLAVIDAPITVERGLHAMFSEHRIRGEWFAPHKDILKFITRLPNVDLPHADPPHLSKRRTGAPLGRKTRFDVEKAKAYLRTNRNVTAAAKHVGVTKQRLWYHVEKDADLLRLLKKPNR